LVLRQPLGDATDAENGQWVRAVRNYHNMRPEGIQTLNDGSFKPQNPECVTDTTGRAMWLSGK